MGCTSSTIWKPQERLTQGPAQRPAVASRGGIDSSKSSKELSPAEIALLAQLELGELEQDCLAKNWAYGHGPGNKGTTREEATLFKFSATAWTHISLALSSSVGLHCTAVVVNT